MDSRAASRLGRGRVTRAQQARAELCSREPGEHVLPRAVSIRLHEVGASRSTSRSVRWMRVDTACSRP